MVSKFILGNTQPKKFGKGAEILKDWDCICGNANKKYMVRCGLCTVERKYSDKAIVGD